MTPGDLATSSRCYCFTGSRFEQAFLYLAAVIAGGTPPPPVAIGITTNPDSLIITTDDGLIITPD